MPGGTAAARQLLGGIGPGQHRRQPVGVLDPGVRGIEDFRVHPQAMENFAEEPLGGIGPAALGQIVRPLPAGQFRDLGRLGVAGVVLPEPRLGVGVVPERLQHRQRRAVAVHGQRRRAGGIDPDADDVLGIEGRLGPPRLRHGAGDGDFHAFEVVRRVLPGDVMVGRVEKDPRLARLILIDGRAQLPAVGHIHNHTAHGVRAVVQADRMFHVATALRSTTLICLFAA